MLAWPVVAAAAARGAFFAGRPAFEPLLHARFPESHYLPAARTRRLALARALRERRAGTALLLTDSFSSALVATLGGIPRRIGYAAEGRGFLLTTIVPRAGRARSAPRAAEYRVLAEAAGLDVAPGEPSLAAVPDERTAGRARLADAGIADAPVAVLA
ncbi:MAG: glycosyltransferase family 9 protein, partial [Bacteroidota bacterium]